MGDIKKIFEQNKPINDDVILKSFYIMTNWKATQKDTSVPYGCYVSLKQHYNHCYNQIMYNQKNGLVPYVCPATKGEHCYDHQVMFVLTIWGLQHESHPSLQLSLYPLNSKLIQLY